MRSLRALFPLAVFLIALAVPSPLLAQSDGPPMEVREMFAALLEVLRSEDDGVYGTFLDAYVDPRLVASEGAGALSERLREIGAAVRGSGDEIELRGQPGDVVLEVSGSGVRVGVTFDEAPPRITGIRMLAPAGPDPEGPPVTWDSLQDRFAEAESAGFAGVVLARRNGATAHEGAYGLADRDEGRATTLETIYGIGSTPIDFTTVAALLLVERGSIALEDPIARFLPDVPEDKRGITIEHLMTGRSGLPDFHDVEGDWDPDLAWIDRSTAVRRILAQPLLFEPGTGNAHSHSAWGLVAAIVEIASGRSYPEFVRGEILEPAGMTRTGFYGETLGYGREDFAVGYGASAVGLPNIPPNWGPTSWLVMGSGGMYSTLGDMDRFHRALEDGRLSVEGWERWRGGEVVDVGGSDRGFYYFRASDGDGDSVMLLMNGEGRSPEIRALSRSLERLVMAEERGGA